MALGERIPTQLRGRRVVLRPLSAATSRRGGRSGSATGAGCSSGSPSRRRARPTTPRAGPPSSPAAAPASASGRWARATGSGSSSTGRFAGEINLSGVQRGPFQNAYVGYWIDEAQAGNGYVPEAAGGGGPLRLRGAGACTACRWPSSPATGPAGGWSEKLELREEGIAHRYLAINGVWEDHIRYALTTEDWTTRRQELLATWIGEPPRPHLHLKPRANRPTTDSPSGRRARR